MTTDRPHPPDAAASPTHTGGGKPDAPAPTFDPAVAKSAAAPRAAGADTADGEPSLPTFAEQMADQLGGWRGLLESSIPVAVFVVGNVVGDLRLAIYLAVGVALAIASLRLAQRRPVRHAVNGLFGIGIGAYLAWKSGEAKDFYLPGLWFGAGYAAALLASVVVRQPLVGWIWSVVVAGGRSDWRGDRRLLRTFNWLTVLWAVVWLIKVGIQTVFYQRDMETALGIARLALGYPPYALLLVLTVWSVRRVTRTAVPAPVGDR